MIGGSLVTLVVGCRMLRRRCRSPLVSPCLQVHPIVLFSVLDHFLRRPEGQKRVIGTLLGTVAANTVEVTNSFAVPHLEKNSEVWCIGCCPSVQCISVVQ